MSVRCNIVINLSSRQHLRLINPIFGNFLYLQSSYLFIFYVNQLNYSSVCLTFHQYFLKSYIKLNVQNEFHDTVSTCINISSTYFIKRVLLLIAMLFQIKILSHCKATLTSKNESQVAQLLLICGYDACIGVKQFIYAF